MDGLPTTIGDVNRLILPQDQMAFGYVSYFNREFTIYTYKTAFLKRATLKFRIYRLNNLLIGFFERTSFPIYRIHTIISSQKRY